MRSSLVFLAAAAVVSCIADPRADEPVAVATGCITNAECVGNGRPAVCRDTKCVDLTTKECPVVLGDVEDLRAPDVLVVGALSPFDSGSELGDAMGAALELAQEELSSSGLSRPLVVLACREFNDDGNAGLVRAADHLVKELQVPVVIGPSDESNAQIVSTQVTLPNDVLMIAPTAITPSLSDVALPHRVWRLNYDAVDQARLLQRFLDNQLVPKLKADGVLGPNEPLRVAIVSEDDFKGRDIARPLAERLRWNQGVAGEGTCAENAALTPSACINVAFPGLNDSEGNPSPESGITQALKSVFTGAPHVVLHAYSVYGIPRVVFPIEGGWEAYDSSGGNRGKPRPYHVGLFPQFNAFAPLYQFVPLQEPVKQPSDKPLSQRLFAVAPRETADSADVARYVEAFKRQHSEFMPSTTPADSLPRLYYDALYMAAYAVVANGAKPASGLNLATTLPQLVSGPPYKVGPSDVAAIVERLSRGAAVNLAGVSGDLDLRPETGASPYGMELTCLGVAASTAPEAIGKGGPYDRFTPSGFRYDPSLERDIGNLPGLCPTLRDALPPDVWPTP